MNLFEGIRNGQLTRESLQKTLADYEVQKIELKRRQSKLGIKLFNNKLNDLNISISFNKLLLEKYDDIVQSKQREA